jgi:tetratricopeptide (TPR) repeat protein
VGQALGVRAVFKGRVMQRGDDLEISAELVDARDNSHIWGQQYSRKSSDIFALQRDLAREITGMLRMRLTGEDEKQMMKSYTKNPEAYQDYLKGRYWWNRRTGEGLNKGVKYFQQAIAEDPAYALAYTGLADSYYLLGYYSFDAPMQAYPRAKEAALKALEIDDTLAEGHAALAAIKRDFDRDWVGAEKEFDRALDLNPDYAPAHEWCANLFNAIGRRQEGLAHMKRAQELDPLSLIINADLGRSLYLARNYDQSLEQLRKTVDLDANFALAHVFLGQVYEQDEMFENAIAEFQNGIHLSGGSTYAMARLGHAYAVAGKRDEAQRVFNQLKDLSKNQYVSAYDIALIYVGLGEKDQAFTTLEQAYEERCPTLEFLKVEPSLDPLRSDPRFADLLRRMNLTP